MQICQKIVAFGNTQKKRLLFPNNETKQTILQKFTNKKKLKEKSEEGLCPMWKIGDKIIRDKPESEKSGEEMNTHQANINRQRNRQAVFGKPQISPTPKHERRHRTDRDFDSQKRKDSNI